MRHSGGVVGKMERISSANVQQAWEVACLERTGWLTYCTSLKKFVKLDVVQHTLFPKSFRNYPGLPYAYRITLGYTFAN